jgi:Putative heavy-metal-binding
MSEGPTDLPEAATRRFHEGAFTSGLTVPDFAACLQMGLEPVGFVQGFCVMQWQWYGMGSPYGTFGTPFQQGGDGYSESWQCPHGFVSAEHRSWGQNYEQSWVEDAWRRGFSSAYDRMLEEASAVGAHGVVGVVDATERLGDTGVLEFRVQGTAVKVTDGQPPADGRPWTTYLAGQRLAKSIEAGFAPVSIAASVASVRVWAYCLTEYLTEGSGSSWGYQGAAGEIEQTSKAHMAVRRIARQKVRSQLGGDSLHGASMVTTERELGQGDVELQCILRGNQVRRFKQFDPMPSPRPTVRML